MERYQNPNLISALSSIEGEAVIAFQSRAPSAKVPRFHIWGFSSMRIWIVESTSRSHGIYTYTINSNPSHHKIADIQEFECNVHAFITRAEQIMLRTQDIYSMYIYTGAGEREIQTGRKNKYKTDDAGREKRWKRLKTTTCPKGNRKKRAPIRAKSHQVSNRDPLSS